MENLSGLLKYYNVVYVRISGYDCCIVYRVRWIEKQSRFADPRVMVGSDFYKLGRIRNRVEISLKSNFFAVLLIKFFLEDRIRLIG